MKITLDRLNENIDQFVTGELIYNAKAGMTKFKLGFLRGTGLLKVTPEQLNMLAGTALVDESGAIDTDALKSAVMAGVEAAGSVSIPQAGITLDKADVDKYGREALEKTITDAVSILK